MSRRYSLQWTAFGLLLLILVGAGASLRYTLLNLGIHTDTAAMISGELPFRQAYERYRREFPALVDRFVVVLDGPTPEQTDAAAAKLADRFKRRPDLFTDVFLPGDDEYFRRNAFLFMEPPELEALAARLDSAQPFIRYLGRDPSLITLAEILGPAINRQQTNPGLPFETLFREMDESIEAMLADRAYAVSWSRLLGPEPDRTDTARRFLLLKPVLDFSEPLAAEPAMQAVRKASAEVTRGPLADVRVRVTGDAALGYEELISALQGAQVAGVLALVMVAIVMLVGLGSFWLTLAALLTLIVGLIFTAGFATAAIGHLNLISVAFAVLYIGLGADYAIHVCLRYRELLIDGKARFDALAETVRSMRGSLLLCTLTTATAFYSFLPTSFSGVSELGLIAGTGMFINFALSMCLLPACLLLLPAPRIPVQRTQNTPYARILETPLRHARAIRWTALILGIVAILVLPELRFDRNPLNLRDPDSESITTIRELMADGELASMPITVLTQGAEESAMRANALRSLAVVDKVVSVEDLLPDATPEKYSIISNLSSTLGALPVSTNRRPDAKAADAIQALAKLAVELQAFAGDESGPTAESARQLATHLEDFLDALPEHRNNDQEALLADLQQRLLGNFAASLSRLHDALTPALTEPALPESIRRRWINPEGLHRLAVYPKDDINDNVALRRFVDGVQTVAADATDEPVLSIEAGDAVVGAFAQAFASALLVISGLLALLLRDMRAVALVLTPLTLAALLTTGTMAVFDIPFNFANVIALPLLFGIGVDNSIHMVMRDRHSSDKLSTDQPGNPLYTSTARAVWFASLTTICSFGNLMLSPHAGTASMGLLLSIGILMTIFCTLVVLPALLRTQFPVKVTNG